MENSEEGRDVFWSPWFHILVKAKEVTEDARLSGTLGHGLCLCLTSGTCSQRRKDREKGAQEDSEQL